MTSNLQVLRATIFRGGVEDKQMMQTSAKSTTLDPHFPYSGGSFGDANSPGNATSPSMHCTFVVAPPLPGVQQFQCSRKTGTTEDLLQWIAKDREEPGNANKNGVALIMPSTFHVQPTVHKDLPNGAEMLLYCGIADLDAVPRHAGLKDALKENIKKAISNGVSVQELSDTCPDFGNVVKAAQVMCAKLSEKGFTPVCWFTGGKGVRVAWFDPNCYMRYQKGDKDVSTRVRDVFFKEYLGDDCLAQIQALCELDKCVYNAGNGVKSDLRRHQDTDFWPFLIDFGDEDVSQNLCMKRDLRDEDLCDKIVKFWTLVLKNLPVCWTAAKPVPGGTNAITTAMNQLDGSKKKRGQSSAEGSSSVRAAKRSKNMQLVASLEDAVSKETFIDKLRELATAMAKIHPGQCWEYNDWIKVLFAVNNHLGCMGSPDVHNVLVAFSSIRDGYRSADDVAQKYDQIQPRDMSQAQVTMGTLVHLAREHPALVLKTQPTPEECAAVRAARDRTAVLLQLLKLLLLHVDPAKTDWRWLLQSCACLFGDRQAFLVDYQGGIIEQYAQVGVFINPDNFKAAFQRPKSRAYRQALVEYIEKMIMEMSESGDEDDNSLETCGDGGGNEDGYPAENDAENDAELGTGDDTGNDTEKDAADNSGSMATDLSAATSAKPEKRRRVVKGRASLLQTAKLVVQLPVSAVCQLLDRNRETHAVSSRWRKLVGRHLRVPEKRKKVIQGLKVCFSSLSMPLTKEGMCAVDVEDQGSDAQGSDAQGSDAQGSDAQDSDAEQDVGGDCDMDESDADKQESESAPASLVSMVTDDGALDGSGADPAEHSQSMDVDGMSSADAVTRQVQAINIDDDTTLQDVVSSNCALRFKEDWSTGNLTPYQMPEAMLKNIALNVDWRQVLVWTCLLIVYQAQAEADQKKKTENAASRAVAKKETAKQKKAADKAAAAAQKAAEMAVVKAEEADTALKHAKRALRNAKTATNTTRADNAAAKAKRCRKRSDQATAEADDKVQEAQEAAAKLQELQNNANDDLSNSGTDFTNEGEGLNEEGGFNEPTLPDILEDYLDMLVDAQESHGVDDETECHVPSEKAFRAAWTRTHASIIKSAKADRMLLGRAVWSVCFDRLFSYQVMKNKFELKHFRLKDSKVQVGITSTGVVGMHKNQVLVTFDQNLVYWGLWVGKNERRPDCYSLDANGFEDADFEKKTFIHEWLKDPNPREFDRIDSIPPSRSGNAAPSGVYNLWPGFRAETLPPVTDDVVHELVQPILNHFRDVITGEEGLDFLLAWLAQQVQDPAHLTGVAIILQGKQGVGKDIVFDFWIKMVLGGPPPSAPTALGTGYKTSNPSEFIFGKHSVASQNKVFLLLDEISGDKMRPLMDNLKSQITCDTVNINPKGSDMYTVRNLSNFLCTTNHKNPLPIEPEERRFVVFKCNHSKKGDTAYFQRLGNHLKRDDVARAFFQYLREHIDVGPFLPFEAHRPRTDAYIAMQQRSIPDFFQFLSAQIDKTGVSEEQPSRIRASDFYALYTTWAREGNHKIENRTQFGKRMRELMKDLEEGMPSQDVLTKRECSYGKEYSVKWMPLKAHLQKSMLYDPDSGM